MHSVPKNKAARKQGIALIVVLALLAMLVIMSVTFVVFMRTERTASSDYAEFVKARSIAQAGLTRALIRMQQDMNSTSNQFYHSGWIYTPKSTVLVPPPEQCTNWLGSGYESNYVPLTYAADLSAARMVGGPVYWTNLVIKTITGDNKLIGRFSYMVFDCSDFVDINAITNRVRMGGIDPGELSLPQPGVPSTLVTTRNTAHPFESLCELSLCNGAVSVPHVVTYSYAPFDSYFTNNAAAQTQPRLYITTNVATLKTMVPQIQAITAKAGFDPAFANLLVDFADTSTDVRYNDPTFTRMGGGKLVPMLYQIAATNGMRRTVVAGQTRWEVETRVFYETWYPFPVTANKIYHLLAGAVPQASIPTPPMPGFPWAPCTVSNGWQTTPTTVTPVAPNILTSLPFYTNSFWTNAYVIVYTNGFTGTLVSASTTLTLPAAVSVMNNNGQAVDKPTFPAAVTAPTPFPVALVGASVAPILQYGVVDPRINYRATDWRHNVIPSQNTIPTLLGRTNEFCDVFGSRYDLNLDNSGDGSTFMYARRVGMDAPGLYSMGDFGYLLYSPDKPWHTVRLSTAKLPAQDRSSYVFNLLNIQTNQVRGFVNPNSQDTNALSSAFLGASRARYYGEVGAPPPVTGPQATTLAIALINKGIRSGIGNAYTNVADVCRLFANYNSFLPGGVCTGDIFAATGDVDLWQQKAVMGNSIGLMNPRQNYWLVLVSAQAVKPIVATATTFTPGTDFVTAEVQCLAYIWRDPFEDVKDTVHPVGSRRHKMYVQFFKWL